MVTHRIHRATVLLIAGAFALALLTLVAPVNNAAACVTGANGQCTNPNAPIGTVVAGVATSNIGGTACGTNSMGGKGFEKSCTGNGGQPEYWCADLARWVWATSGAAHTDTGLLNSYAYSFYTYGKTYGMHSTPKIGDVAIYSVARNDDHPDTTDPNGISHVAVVVNVTDGGKLVHTVSGDWTNTSLGGSEAYFAGHSHVIDNGTYTSTVETFVPAMGYYIVGYVSPVK